MPLLKDGIKINDLWRHVADEDILPASGAVIVGLERWRGERNGLLTRADPVGVRLKSEHMVDDIADDLDYLGVVALSFPAFTDGRAYSHARRLRERFGYTGEIRAIGNVLRDQYLFMVRCGIDALEVREGETEKDWEKAVRAFSVFYQPAADGRASALSLRHR